MLYYVSGQVALLEPGLAVIDCNGVGYGCRVTAYTAAQLKLNQPAKHPEWEHSIRFQHYHNSYEVFAWNSVLAVQDSGCPIDSIPRM